MTEELGLEQVVRQRRGVDDHEGAVSPRGVVQRARHQLLTRASLTQDQHRPRNGRYALDLRQLDVARGVHGRQVGGARGGGATDLRVASGVGLTQLRLLLHLRQLRATDGLQETRRVAHLADGEADDLDAHVGQVGRGQALHVLREDLGVGVDLLEGQGADHGVQMTLHHLVRGLVQLLLVLAQEHLGGCRHRDGIVRAHFELRDGVHHDAALALSERKSARDRRVHELAAEVSASRAQAEVSFALETAKLRREVVERSLEVQELEVRLKEQELRREIDEPAQAARRRVEAEAQAPASKRVAEAQAEAAAERLMGEARADAKRLEALADAEGVRARLNAEAEGTRTRLTAEAEGMRLEAEAWEHHGSAALGQLMIEQLPALDQAVAAPLAQVDKIVLVGNGEGGASIGRMTRGITDVIVQIPAIAGALTGVDLPALLTSVAGQPTVAMKVEEPHALEALEAHEAHEAAE